MWALPVLFDPTRRGGPCAKPWHQGFNALTGPETWRVAPLLPAGARQVRMPISCTAAQSSHVCQQPRHRLLQTLTGPSLRCRPFWRRPSRTAEPRQPPRRSPSRRTGMHRGGRGSARGRAHTLALHPGGASRSLRQRRQQPLRGKPRPPPAALQSRRRLQRLRLWRRQRCCRPPRPPTSGSCTEVRCLP